MAELDDDYEDDDEEGTGATTIIAPPARAAIPAALPILPSQQRGPGQRPYQPKQFGEPEPGAQPFFISGAEPAAPSGSRSIVKDFARQAWASTVGVGNELLGFVSLADRQLTGNPQTVAHIEQTRRNLSDYMTSQLEQLSPQAKKAYQSSLFGTTLFGGQADEEGRVPSPGDVGWGNYAASVLADFVPNAVMAVLPGGLVGRAVTKSLGTLAGTAARVGTTGALFGAQQSGASYEALVDEVDKAKPAELMQSPVYSTARQNGVSDVDSRRLLVKTRSPGLAQVSC
jgi:hypothetical protein